MARIPEFNKQMDYLRLQQSIEQDASFKSELNQLQESIRFELNMRKEYSRALQRENITWWQPEIDTLKKRTDESRDPYHRLALQRIKGFLGILSYTLCNQCIQLENYSDLERLLPIYEYLEPRNPDMFYFKACLAWEKGQEKAAVAALQQSVENGFCDWQRMTAEFPQKLLQQLPDSRREL